jgi:hypothetical protein
VDLSCLVLLQDPVAVLSDFPFTEGVFLHRQSLSDLRSDFFASGCLHVIVSHCLVASYDVGVSFPTAHDDLSFSN